MAKFCSNCGSALNDGARFCHSCGVAAGANTASGAGVAGRKSAVFWTPVIIMIVAVTALITVQFNSTGQPQSDAAALGGQPGLAPDLSTISPEDQASRLFDRVMRLASEGKTDSAAFFAPMAIGAIENVGPADSHRRYDMGMVGFMTGDFRMAAAKADTILASRPTHLLGLALAARTADAQKKPTEAAAFRKRLVAAEASELAANLSEYSLHANDVSEAIRLARKN